MPHRSKKKFIDKKSAVTFHLVHRSQRDPLAADDEAPQRVLVPVDPNGVECQIVEETPQKREQRICIQKTYGIGFDDDYDYMQHLRETDKHTAVLIPMAPKHEPGVFRDEEISDKPNNSDIVGREQRSIRVPSIALASKQEEDVGMLHRAIPPVGPQVDWDADVVAAMDEDFNFDDPQNALDDDFILHATAGKDSDGIDDVCSYQDTDNDSDNDSNINEGPDNAFFDQFLEEETRSRFTQYSMSSSVLPRSNQLTLLDDQFEKFYEKYDEDRIGDLAPYEIDGLVQDEALRVLLGMNDKSDEASKDVKTRMCQTERPAPKEDRSAKFSNGYLDEEDDGGAIDVLVERLSKDKWDCESIISTYSNIYNHPKLIKDESSNQIKLSKKTGMPLDTLRRRGLTAKQLHTYDLQSAADSNRMRTTSETSSLAMTLATVRQKGETREEKIARKQVVKEIKRERRAEKKATRVAFQQERNRQKGQLLNLHNRLKCVKIS